MKNLEKYLKNMLDNNVSVKEVSYTESLKIYLSVGYDFYLVDLLGDQFVIIEPKEEKTAAQIIKQCAILESELDLKIVVCEKEISRYKVKKYIDERQPFICVPTQIYLPFLGMHMRKHRQPASEKPVIKKFSPSMQLAFLWILYYADNEVTIDAIIENINCSKIQASRILTGFASLGLLQYDIGGKTGREKTYTLNGKKKFYEQGKSYLINPVKRVIYVRELPTGINFYTAGLQALSEKSLLGVPKLQVVATTNKNILIEKHQVDKMEAIDEHLYEVQIMKYDFSLLAKDNCVDPISLIFSLEETDDRIEIAIDEMMRDYSWYVD